ncbi:hypothetical protein ACHAPE_004436 [Trichoderma viride]
MEAGEIPVNYLTHLNVAFGYITPDFRITNMDGVSPDIYQSVGDVKSRNPNLKLLIALGGWRFSDPGPRQSVFPDMVSTAANRAIFIKNTLEFLENYGYDGLDFDWEYPGADDRGGTEKDGENYAVLLKELRAAIKASGRDYLITFTAPTSYWYLRHYDLENMVPHVDWVNLMSYDLHGVWDGNNTIGKQVLAHTNLTEIDLSLDLIKMAFGRLLTLFGDSFGESEFNHQRSSWDSDFMADPSPWKTLTVGSPDVPLAAQEMQVLVLALQAYYLSEVASHLYTRDCIGVQVLTELGGKEITDVLRRTGATAYWDKKAAVKYLPYGKNSWISFDDAQTIPAKIDYANRLGLSGLLIWAIDLDNGQLDALRAVSNPSIIDNDRTSLDLIDIKNIFPTEYLPPNGYTPKYGLVSFGGSLGSTNMDPSNGGFGFFLVSGDSHVASPLTKRDNEPDPFEFLDCHGTKVALQSGISKARVACFSEDVQGCFRVMEQGIEGTLVELPDHCFSQQYARAVSIRVSPDQYIPKIFGGRQPTSQVFDFYFDFNMGLVRRDTNNTSIRIDYSNVKGYWNSVVNSPGIQSRDLTRRFFAPSSVDWQKKYSSDGYSAFEDSTSFDISEDVQAPLLWQTAQDCPVDGSTFNEGIGAYIKGKLNAHFLYGFSLVASLDREAFQIQESNGFLHVSGNTNFTYAIGGIGSLDISEAGKGNPAISDEVPITLGGHAINAGSSANMATFEPFYQIQYEMATMNGTDIGSFGDDSIPFNGRLQTRILSDFGDSTLYFPISKTESDAAPKKRDGNRIVVPKNNVLYNGLGYGRRIALSSIVTFGLKSKLLLGGQNLPLPIDLPNMSVTYNTMTEFVFSSEKESSQELSCAGYSATTLAYQSQKDTDFARWNGDQLAEFAYESQTLEDERHCYNETNHTLLGGRGKLFGWGYSAGKSIDVSDFLKDEAVLAMFDTTQPKFDCNDCVGCGEEQKKRKEDFCCGCVNPPEEGEWIPGHQPRSEIDEEDEKDHVLEKRSNGTATLSPKVIKLSMFLKVS